MRKQNVGQSFVFYIDLIRIAAVLAVIALHTSAVRVVRYGEIDPASWWTANVIDSLSRWAVPIFIMVSGILALDLQKPFSGKILRRRLMRVGFPLLFWSMFYFCWKAAYYGEGMSWQEAWSAFAAGLPENHLYFLFIIIGLYGITPALRLMLLKIPAWSTGAFIGLLFAAATSGLLFMHVKMNALTRFIPYITYYLIGYLLHKLRLSTRQTGFAAVIYLLTSFGIIAGTGYLISTVGGNDYYAFLLYDHFHVLVFLQTAGIFFVLKYLGEKLEHLTSKPLISQISSVTFGIYLVHLFVLDLVRSFTAPLTGIPAVVMILVEVVVTFTISGIIVFCTASLPVLRIALGGVHRSGNEK